MKHTSRRTAVLAVSPAQPAHQRVDKVSADRAAPVWRNFAQRQEHKGAVIDARVRQRQIVSSLWRPDPCFEINKVKIKRARRIPNGSDASAGRFNLMQDLHQGRRIFTFPSNLGDGVQKRRLRRIRPGGRPPGPRTRKDRNLTFREQLQRMLQVFKRRVTTIRSIGSQGDEYAPLSLIQTNRLLERHRHDLLPERKARFVH